jgi:hypothetical protein
MTSRRPRSIGPKTLLLTGTVLAGITLGGCALPTSPANNAPLSTSNSAPSQQTLSSGSKSSTSDSPSAGQDTASSSAKPQPSQTDRCHTSQLSASLQPDQAGMGMGGRTADLILRNTSKQTCTIEGYPGMQLFSGGDGRSLPTNVVRYPNPGPQLVKLAPGASAQSLLQWSAIGNGQDEPGDGSPCEPAVGQANITPPDERDPLSAQWFPSNGMAFVCDHGTIKATAFHQ